VSVEGANRNDFKMARQTLESVPIPRPEPTPAAPQGLCLDKGYDYEEVRALVAEFGYTAHIRPRGEAAAAIQREGGYKARRWVVERTQSWMNRFRRLLIRWEKKPENYLAMLHLACALITFRAAGLPGLALNRAAEAAGGGGAGRRSRRARLRSDPGMTARYSAGRTSR
jgi:putative transposase